MCRSRHTWGIAAVTAVVLVRSSIGAPPTMNFQGFLEDAKGNPIVGSVGVDTRIYDAVVDGNELWSEPTHPSVLVQEGVFKITLGTDTSLTPEVFSTDAYLEIEIEGEVLSPRIPLRSVPYAFQAVEAQNADTLDNLDSSEFVRHSDLKLPGFLMFDNIWGSPPPEPEESVVIAEDSFVTTGPAVVTVDGSGLLDMTCFQGSARVEVLIDDTLAITLDKTCVGTSNLSSKTSVDYGAIQVEAGKHTVTIVYTPGQSDRFGVGEFRVMYWEIAE